MARTKGSTELFDLIHSLSPEEKGYYKKFSKRHIPNGSNYLKLFDAIAAQDAFEEATLRARFKNYTVMKVYLKDFITDSLLLYYKNKHPHVNLLSQVQKVHILLVKGQYTEAVRILKKTLVQSRKLELFTIERYLLRIWAEINHHRLTHPDAIIEFQQQYANNLKQNLVYETDLSEWELRSTEWLAKVRGLDMFDKPQPDVNVNSMQKLDTLGIRSEIKKLNCLSYLHLLRKEINEKHRVNKQLLDLSEKFKREGDQSYNNVYIRNNYISCLLDLNQFTDTIRQSDEMIKSESKFGYYEHLAFPKAILFKLDAYYHLGKFKEGLDLVYEVEKKMQQISDSLGDYTAWKEFCFFKHTFLFVNRRYRECWIDMQSVDLKTLQKNYPPEYADYSLLALMLQYEMNNFGTLKNMVTKTAQNFNKTGITDETYLQLVAFFKAVKPENAKALAEKTVTTLDAYYKKTGLQPRRCFALVGYTQWLKAVSQQKYLEDLL
ncbi:MAG TPA: hypothetical protein PLW44_13470 [Chitinophagales bacterium]|nr:hypothetical protein [Chitinophagales bacterium]